MIALPGAWAMGDGMVLEMAPYPCPPTAGRRRRASVTSYISTGSESLARLAGSFTASMNEYIQDLAQWATESGPEEEGAREGEITVDGGSFYDGGQLLFPRSNSYPRSGSAGCSDSKRSSGGTPAPPAAASSKKDD
ncbi:hypothetical protein GPECTOR_12g368 [Gonium pectorale]|uniref:Uncharacterized protein n=1 Tax=Gonium pectorale TaxID=33097 RepID=A0A150GNH1_GONPE|nr:hypothetical protein GPECTOR_12g368 [Gonium pectorale]|eukprot:KXZ51406.1 hypothetical protein GPECTOR_12g368 [Gonium pectorale]